MSGDDMNIGRMNKRIIIQQFLKIDGKSEWVTRFTVWAEFKIPDNKTVEIAGSLASETTQEINIRYNPEIKKGWRVLGGGGTFEIKQRPYDYNKSTTVLICREVTL